MSNVVDGITKGEIKFWMGLIVIFVTGAIAFNTLKMTVSAMQDKGAKLRTEYEQSMINMEDDIETIRNDQVKIMIKMGLQPSAD